MPIETKSMPRPSLASHETRLALIEQRAEQRHADGKEHDLEVLKALREIRDDVKELRGSIDGQVKELSDRQSKTETRVEKIFTTARAFGGGFAAAFTLLGAALATGLNSILENFR